MLKNSLSGKYRVKHSRLGITSFTIAILDRFIWLTLFGIAVSETIIEIIRGEWPGTWEEKGLSFCNWTLCQMLIFLVYLFLTAWFFAGPIISFWGIALGIAGLVQRTRIRTFSVIGVILNVLFVPVKVLLFVLCLIMSMRGRPPWDATP
jgi:hypothetical protein